MDRLLARKRSRSEDQTMTASESLFNERSIRIRWSEYHHKKFLELGGTKWLCEQVDLHLPESDRFIPHKVRAERDEKIISLLKGFDNVVFVRFGKIAQC